MRSKERALARFRESRLLQGEGASSCNLGPILSRNRSYSLSRITGNFQKERFHFVLLSVIDFNSEVRTERMPRLKTRILNLECL